MEQRAARIIITKLIYSQEKLRTKWKEKGEETSMIIPFMRSAMKLV